MSEESAARSGVIVTSMGAVVALAAVFAASPARAYPPAVGILGKSSSCTSCHVSNGPWRDDQGTIIDVLDATTKKTLRQEDGTFRLDVPRGEVRTVLTVVGRRKGEPSPPKRNAWLYVDPAQIETSAFSKFAPGWDVNLPMSCRLVGDATDAYPGAHVTVLPMSIRPGDAARDAEIELQVMLTAGDAAKPKDKDSLVSSYFVRKVKLHVVER